MLDDVDIWLVKMFPPLLGTPITQLLLVSQNSSLWHSSCDLRRCHTRACSCHHSTSSHTHQLCCTHDQNSSKSNQMVTISQLPDAMQYLIP